MIFCLAPLALSGTTLPFLNKADSYALALVPSMLFSFFNLLYRKSFKVLWYLFTTVQTSHPQTCLWRSVRDLKLNGRLSRKAVSLIRALPLASTAPSRPPSLAGPEDSTDEPEVNIEEEEAGSNEEEDLIANDGTMMA